MTRWSNPSSRDLTRDCKFSYTLYISKLSQYNPLGMFLHPSSIFLAAYFHMGGFGSIHYTCHRYISHPHDYRQDAVSPRAPMPHHGHAPASGRQVRRKDWAETTQRFPTFTTEYWDASPPHPHRRAMTAPTSLKEKIPPSFRSTVGISIVV